MAVTNFEEAFFVVGLARTVVERHNNLLSKFAQGRADYDLAMVNKPENFQPRKIEATLKEIHNDIREYERRIVHASEAESFGEFRRLAMKAQSQLGEVLNFEEMIDTTEYYLAIYEGSGVGPQALEDGEEYIVEEKQQVLANIRTQSEKATELLIATAQAVDIGEVSSIELPPSIIIPS